MSTGLFFCTFPPFLHRNGGGSHSLGCVFHSCLLCPDAGTVALCLQQAHRAACHSAAEPTSSCSGLSGPCLLCRALVESVQIGVTTSGQHPALFLWGRSVVCFLEGGPMLRGDLKLCILKSRPPKMFYVPDSIMFPI